MTMKFIYAKPLDESRSAVVFDMGNGKVLGGVVIISEFSNEYKPGTTLSQNAKYEGINRSRIQMHWEWSKSVSAVDLKSGKASLFDRVESEPEMKTVKGKTK